MIHAGGLPEQWVGDDSVFERVNAQGTLNMANAALAQRVEKFVYVSTQDMFDFNAAVFDETMPVTAPLASAYERSKQHAEELVEQAVIRGLPAVFIHPVAVYGPGSVLPSGLNQFLCELQKGELPILIDGGMPVVLNTSLAKGIVALKDKAPIGEHYLFSDGYQSLLSMTQSMNILEHSVAVPKVMPNFVAGFLAVVGELIAKITRSKPLISRGELGVLRRKGRPSTAKVEQFIGWQPTPFDKGLYQTLPWLKEKGEQ